MLLVQGPSHLENHWSKNLPCCCRFREGWASITQMLCQQVTENPSKIQLGWQALWKVDGQMMTWWRSSSFYLSVLPFFSCSLHSWTCHFLITRWLPQFQVSHGNSVTFAWRRGGFSSMCLFLFRKMVSPRPSQLTSHWTPTSYESHMPLLVGKGSEITTVKWEKATTPL